MYATNFVNSGTMHYCEKQNIIVFLFLQISGSWVKFHQVLPNSFEKMKKKNYLAIQLTENRVYYSQMGLFVVSFVSFL